MNFFIIGDVHGCFFTLEKLLKHWNPEEEQLIFLGDLIDRGNYSSKVIEKCMVLQEAYPDSIILKGNHEYEFIEHYEKGENLNWTRQCGDKTLEEFKENRVDLQKIYNWFKSFPLSYETQKLMLTHAGITETKDPFLEDHEDSVLWNRKSLKNIDKLQVHGHTPLKQNIPLFHLESNSVNIDTGAVYGYGLTWIKVNEDADIIKVITVETDSIDAKLTKSFSDENKKPI